MGFFAGRSLGVSVSLGISSVVWFVGTNHLACVGAVFGPTVDVACVMVGGAIFWSSCCVNNN